MAVTGCSGAITTCTLLNTNTMTKPMTRQQAILLLSSTDLNKLNAEVDRKNRKRTEKLPYVTADMLDTLVKTLPIRK